jgi:hypothetical protein
MFRQQDGVMIDSFGGKEKPTQMPKPKSVERAFVSQKI